MTSTVPSSIDPESGAALERDAVAIISGTPEFAQVVAELTERTGRT